MYVKNLGGKNLEFKKITLYVISEIKLKKSMFFFSSKKPAATEKTVKYTGAELMDKGVLFSLEGVPTSQLKNVAFEISSSEVRGVFRVQCKFMGVDVESADIDMQVRVILVVFPLG